MKLASILCLITICTFSGCSTGRIERNDNQVVNKMSWLLDAHPYYDYLSAIEAEDFRFKGVYGYSLRIPQVHRWCINDIEKEVNPIEGTSDAVESYEHARMQAIAQVYASWFNTYMRAYLEDIGEFTCVR